MLLPSVAISIAINYLGNSLDPIPTTTIALVAVFLPSTLIGIFLWLRS
jgi:anaerobic C4-dicarboxylate transporter